MLLENASKRGIKYKWEIRNALGNMVYKNGISELMLLEYLIIREAGASMIFRGPSENGVYRLRVFAAEGEDHVAYSNIIFTVGGWGEK